MTASRVHRRAALTALPLCALSLGVLLAGCSGPAPPTVFAPLSWDYLPRLRLKVANIVIDDFWTPRSGTREIGFLAPTPPVDALRKMAEDRLVASGDPGRALFVVQDASIVQVRENYEGSFAVHLDISTSDGTRSGYAEARVTRKRAVLDSSAAGTRAELYDMVKQMMTDMNVEFEYQVRRSLHDYLQAAEPAAPQPDAVDQQELAPPGTRQTLPAPPAPDLPTVPSAVPFSSPEPAPLAP